MSAYLFLAGMVLFTSVLAVIHANKDTSTFHSNDTTFSHIKVWLERAAHVIIGATLLYFSLLDLQLVPAMIITGAMAPLFSLLFRPILNAFRKKPWWYMGPQLFLRRKGDSVLDKVYHLAAWYVTGRRYSVGVAHKYPLSLPFILATIVEAIALAGLVLAASKFSTVVVGM